MVGDEKEAVGSRAGGEVIARGAEVAGDEGETVDAGGGGMQGAAVPDGLPDEDEEAGERGGGAAGVGGGVEALFQGETTKDGSLSPLGKVARRQRRRHLRAESGDQRVADVTLAVETALLGAELAHPGEGLGWGSVVATLRGGAALGFEFAQLGDDGSQVGAGAVGLGGGGTERYLAAELRRHGAIDRATG